MCIISFQEGSFFMVHLSEVGSMWLEEGAVQVLLAGVWLREYGFEVGRKYVADITAGQIVIKLIDSED
jgi:hypothetical protein